MPETCNEQFIPALSHEDAVVRGYAAQLLATCGGTEVLPSWRGALQSGSPSARRAAAETLETWGRRRPDGLGGGAAGHRRRD